MSDKQKDILDGFLLAVLIVILNVLLALSVGLL